MADKELQAALARISTLQEQVNGLASQVGQLAASVQAETQARTGADSAFATRLVANEKAIAKQGTDIKSVQDRLATLAAGIRTS